MANKKKENVIKLAELLEAKAKRSGNYEAVAITLEEYSSFTNKSITTARKQLMETMGALASLNICIKSLRAKREAALINGFVVNGDNAEVFFNPNINIKAAGLPTCVAEALKLEEQKQADRTEALEGLKMYTLTEIEPILGVSHNTLANYVKGGKLKAIKIGGKWKVSQDTLEDFINNR